MTQYVGTGTPHKPQTNVSVSPSSISEQALCIILVDVHKLMRSALQHVVSTFPHLHIAASLTTIAEVPAAIGHGGVHTIVLGPSVPTSHCLELVNVLSKQEAAPGLVVIHQGLHPETAIILMRNGIHGLLDESASEQDLVTAITAAATGNTFFCQRARTMLDISMSKAPVHLTGREVQVLDLLRHGESNFRIAHALGLKVKTVEKYLTQIYDKLHVTSRTEAILYIQKIHL